jgi:hypothetical protein
MTTQMAIEVNCTTGEQTERPLTAEEIDLQAQSVKQYALEMEKAEAKAAAKASAEAKLTALGLTAEEIAAL